MMRDQILGAQDLVTERVDVPEWGGTVGVRTMTGAERDAFEASFFQGRGTTRTENLANLRARLLVRVLVDEPGERIFRDDDAEALGRKSVAVLNRLFAVAQRLNGMSPKEVEDLAGNSGPGPSAASTSG